MQVPLMATLPTVQATLDAHRGVAAVAEHGLYFLRILSLSDANLPDLRAANLRPLVESLLALHHAHRSISVWAPQFIAKL
jgi:hypothetical protein